MEAARYCFDVEWFDVHAQLSRNYQLFFYPSDNSVEMYDVKQRRTFLKKTRAPDLKLPDLFVGAAVNVCSRQLSVRGYGDEFTNYTLNGYMERSVLIIKPHAIEKMGLILDEILQHQFIICRARMLKISAALVEKFVKHSHITSSEYQYVAESFEGGAAAAFELMRSNAVDELKILAGPETVESAREISPTPLRGVYGVSGYQNAIHISVDENSAKNEIQSIFGEVNMKKVPRTANFKNSTLALIRPHAINHGQTGKIIDAITKSGFVITDIEMFHLDRINAEEFLEVYKGLVPEYLSMLDHLTSGAVLAMEISGNEDIVARFREFCGPSDPELARQLRPNSLRARFGLNKVLNALHCTDLPEDGVLEVQYFFRILVE